MNNRIRFLLLIFVFSYTSCSVAQLFTVGGSISFGSPGYPALFRDLYKQDIGVNGILKWNFLNKTSMVLRLAYQPIKPDISRIEEEVSKKLTLPSYMDSLDAGKFEIWMVSLNMMQYFQKKGTGYRLFITAGVEYSFRKVNVTKFALILDDSDTFKFDPKDGNQFGLNGGLGLEIDLADNFCLYVQGVYHFLLIDDLELWNPKTGVIEVHDDAYSVINTSIGLLIDI